MSHRALHTLISLMVGLAALVLTPQQSLAEPLYPDTQVVFEPTADVEVSSDGSSDSDGPNLSIAYSTISSHSFLRFDLADLLPADAVVTKAELRLQQTNANGTDFTFNVQRIAGDWDETTINWKSKPSSFPGVANVSTPATTGQAISVDVTAIAQLWHNNPALNYGFELTPNQAPTGSRVFAASETRTPPQLVVEYTQPVAPVTAVNTGDAPKFDGICDTSGDYAAVTPQYYAGLNGVAYPIYIKHTSSDLYVCATGYNPGQLNLRAFALYFDTDLSDDDSGATLPDADDFMLRMEVDDEVLSAGVGDGNVDVPYARFNNPTDFGDWAAQYDGTDEVESAEFRISLAALRQHTPWCGASVALAVRHEDVRTAGDDFGWPALPSDTAPSEWYELRLQNPMCPIRVCVVDPDTNACDTTSTAMVYRTGDGTVFNVDENGTIANRSAIAAGQQLWALHPLVQQPRYTAYATNGSPDTVTWEAFNEVEPLGEMRISVSGEEPLMVHDFNLSTQWALTAGQQEKLAARIRNASDFLYSFTGGQVVLGEVTAYQNYDNWQNADLWLYGNHNLRPKATAGGVVTAPLEDPGGADHTYYPGYVHMGREWNRYQVPPGQPVEVDGVPVDLSTLENDWSIVLAHELGHYLFFLYDTYFGISSRNTVDDVYSCTGSAMGWVYEQENWGLIGDPAFWQAACSTTQAHQTLGRDEWETILLHYDFLKIPESTAPGMLQPPVNLTNVTFVPPANGQTPLANQLFDLAYEENETASRKAHAFIYQGNRVLSQGNVVKGTTQIELVGAQAGDRFCVYDIDAAPPAPDTPRHQYGCEVLKAGDNLLDLERTPSWRPIVLIDPIGPTSFAISVTQAATGAPVVARFFPEHTDTVFDVPLSSQGNLHTGKIDLPNVTPSAFVQLYVDEDENEDAEADNPRREAMAMFGVDGGTVPGPSSMGAKAPVYSSDGQAQAWPLEALILEPGQWVSLQYMVETFPNQTNTTRVTDAYRAISWPPELIDELVVAVRIPDELAAAQTAQTPAATRQAEPFFIRFWDGSRWQAVPTNRVLGEDDRYLASAIVPMGAPFAVFSGEDATYLPLLATEPNP